MNGVVALDVERAHRLIGQLDGAMDALVAEPSTELVYGQIEPLAPVDILGIPEQVVLHGLLHRHEVRGAHMDSADGVLLVERLVSAYKAHARLATSVVRHVGVLKVVCLE